MSKHILWNKTNAPVVFQARVKGVQPTSIITGHLIELSGRLYIIPLETSYNEIELGIQKGDMINAIWEHNDFVEVEGPIILHIKKPKNVLGKTFTINYVDEKEI